METKLCSKCETKKEISLFHKKDKRLSSWCKSCIYTCQKQRWKDRKKKAVELLGGQCNNCGYKKNFGALDFHHIDPVKKDVSWNKLRLRSWKSIVKELEKCVLLCKNCHVEHHHPDLVIDGTDLTDNVALNRTLQPTGKCPECESPVFGTKFCSTECVSYSRRKVKRPNNKELKLLLKTHSFVSIGKQFGVSDNTIKKWAKQCNLV